MTLATRATGSGRPGVLVHGFPMDASMWAETVEALGGQRRTIAVDLAGFGRSEPVADAVLTMERHADDLAALIDDLASGPVDLVGFSMGGFALLALWERRPELVRSLALVAARANADDAATRARREELAAILLERGRTALYDALLPSLVAPAHTPRARALLRTMIEGTRAETSLAALGGLRDRPDRTALLETITVPVLAVAGEHDAMAPVATMEEVARRAPDGHLVVVPGAGHCIPLEAPGAVAAALRHFWTRTD